MHFGRCGNTLGQQYHANGSRQESKTQEFVYRDGTNVVHEMYCATSNYKSHIAKCPNVTDTGNDERHHKPFDAEPVHVVHRLKAIPPTVTVEWPTVSIDNWLSNVDCHTDRRCKPQCDRSAITDQILHNNRRQTVTLYKTIKAAYSADVAISNSHNLHSTVTKMLQIYTYFKEQLIRTWQKKAVYVMPPVISTMSIIPNKSHKNLSCLILVPALFVPMQKAAILN